MKNPVTSPIQPYIENDRVVGARLCHFGSGSPQLLNGHKDWLTKYFVPKMKQSPGPWIDVYGHTSRLGSEKDNDKLGLARVHEVVNFIKNQHPSMNIPKQLSAGEADAQSFSLEEKNNDGYWRSVLIRWFGVPLPVETPAYPPEIKPTPSIRVAPKGCWCIVGVDTFGIPIKAGVSGGTAEITLLNDKGEKYSISGIGPGVGAGVDIGPKIAEKGIGVLLKALKEIGLKAGDLQNVSDKVKSLKLTGPSETGGGVFRRATWGANLSIHDITKAGFFTIGSGEAQLAVAGGEVGLISFADPVRSALTLGVLVYPWGFYTSLGLGTLKAALGGSGTTYKITKVEKQ
jgi:hypothetical protein